MKNPPNSSEQALEDYFKDLLCSEPVPTQIGEARVVDKVVENKSGERGGDAPFKATVVDVFAARPALTSVARPAPRTATDTLISTTTAPLRAYAEPIKTLNMRMPLPALAPAPAPVEVTDIAAAAAVPTARIGEPIAKQEPALLTTPAVTTTETVATEAVTPPIELAEPTGDHPLVNGPAHWLDNGRPAWAQRPFECLLFKVGGLALAAPLAELGSIYPLDMEMLTAIFGQAAWFMGLLPVKGANVRTIDAAQVVMPERYGAAMRADYRYVITLHGSDWGLAVDSVANSVVLQPDDVRWRGQRSKRPWLAGTVVAQMCALLDVAQLIWMFQNQDRKRIAPPP